MAAVLWLMTASGAPVLAYRRLTGGMVRFCEALVESGWLVCLIVVPLYLNLLSTTVFEPDKLAIFRTVAAVMGAVWTVRFAYRFDGIGMALTSLKSFLRVPLVLPVLLMTVSSVVSAAFSVEPGSSWWGSHSRSQGALTTVAFACFFLVALHCLRRKTQWRRALFVMVLTSVPVSLYGIAQFLGLDPLPWSRIFEGGWGLRVTSTLGNPIFLGSYLLAPIFIGLGWLLSSRSERRDDPSTQPAVGRRPGTAFQVTLGMALLINLCALALTSSRGPLLGLLAGGGFLLMILGLWCLSAPGHRVCLAKRAIVALALFVLVGALGLTALFVTRARSVLRDFEGYHQPAAPSGLLPRTVVVRILIWNAVAELMTSSEPVRYSDGTEDGLARFRPWIGFGPETFEMALLRYYPPGLSRFADRRSLPDRAHNLILQTWVTRGWIGVAALLYFLISLLCNGFGWLGLAPTRRDRKRLAAALTAGTMVGGGLSLALFPWTLGLGAVSGLLAGICFYVLLVCLGSRGAFPTPAGSSGGWLLAALLAALAAHFIELQSGIETASTQIHFWFLAAAVVALGEGRLAPTRTISEASDGLQGLRERADVLAHGFLIALVMVSLGFDFFANWGFSMAAKGVGGPLGAAMQPSPLFAFSVLLLIPLAAWLTGGLLLTGRPALPSLPRQRWKRGGAAVVGSFLLFYLFLSVQNTVSKSSVIRLSETDVVRDWWTPSTFYWFVLLFFLGAVAWVVRLELSPSRTSTTAFAPMMAVVACVLVYWAWQAEYSRVEGDVLYKRARAAASVGDFNFSFRVYDHLVKAGLPTEWLHLLAKTEARFKQARLLPPTEREETFHEMETDLLRAQGLRRLDVGPLEGLAEVATLRAELADNERNRARLLEDARRRWIQAVALAPRTGYLHYGLAMADLGLGKNQEAEQALVDAVRLDPGLEEARRALHALSSERSPEREGSNPRVNQR